MMKINKLSKSFGGLKALSDFNLEISKSKIVAIIGPNGSGKTTLFNVISQLIKQDEGEVKLGEQKLSDKEDFQVAKSGISRTFQDVRLFRNLNIREHLEIALSDSNENLIVSLFKKKINNEERIKKVLNLVGLEKPLGTYATDLSYGQRKLLDLAIAIAKPHEILMLDEPVAGINPKLRIKIKEILKTLRKRGESILLIEHDMNFVMNLADYVYVLDNGEIIAKGTPRKIQKNKKVLEAYLGE